LPVFVFADVWSLPFGKFDAGFVSEPCSAWEGGDCCDGVEDAPVDVSLGFYCSDEVGLPSEVLDEEVFVEAPPF